MATSGGSASRGLGKGFRRFILFMFLVMFTGGFVAGVAATRRMATAPAWMQRLFGLPVPGLVAAPAAAPLPAASAPPIAAPAPTNTAPLSDPQTASSQKPEAAEMPPAETEAVSPETERSEPEPPRENGPRMAIEEQTDEGAAASTAKDLEKMVKDYNAALRTIQGAQASYDTAYVASAPGKPRSPNAQVMMDKAVSSMTTAFLRAQSLLLSLRANPRFADRYREVEAAIKKESLPPSLADTGVENLRFLRPIHADSQ